MDSGLAVPKEHGFFLFFFLLLFLGGEAPKRRRLQLCDRVGFTHFVNWGFIILLSHWKYDFGRAAVAQNAATLRPWWWKFFSVVTLQKL